MTIIVLLILAGITIATLTGDNGIIKEASEAKDETDIASIKEEVKLVWYEVVDEKVRGNLTNEEVAHVFQEKLQKQDNTATVKWQKSNKTYEVTYKGIWLEIQVQLLR